MALTKADIIESVHNQLGFPKRQSAELMEILIETKKGLLNQERMFWSADLGNFV